jgi:hypothetical protein
MRVLIPVALAAMTLLFAGWTQSSENQIPWNPGGKAVVKTPGGVSHVIRDSACYLVRPERLRFWRFFFGGTSINSDLPYMSLLVSERKGNPTVLDIEDGNLRLPHKSTFAVLGGTAHVQVRPVERGTFVLFIDSGNGVTGKARYTGSWKCV